MLLSFWRKKLDESFYKSQVHKLILTYERSSIHFTLFYHSSEAKGSKEAQFFWFHQTYFKLFIYTQLIIFYWIIHFRIK